MIYYGFSISSYQNEGENYNNQWYELEKEGLVPKFGDQYKLWNNYESIIPILIDLNVNAFRFSIEWSRIFPEKEKIDNNSLNVYLNFIKKLKENEIEPFVTLWHYTNPIWFEKIGGWKYKENIQYFLEYADYLIKKLKEYNVKYVVTFNEILNYSTNILMYKVLKKEIEIKEIVDSIYNTIKNMFLASEECAKILKENEIYSIHSENFSIIRILKKLFFEFYIEPLYIIKKYIPKEIDIYGVNFYGLYNSIEDSKKRNAIFSLDLLENILKKLKDKKIVITEIGKNTENEYERMKIINDTIEFVKKKWRKYNILGIFFWTLYDNYEWEEGYENNKFGIMGRNLERKTSYFFTKKKFEELKLYNKLNIS